MKYLAYKCFEWPTFKCSMKIQLNLNVTKDRKYIFLKFAKLFWLDRNFIMKFIAYLRIRKKTLSEMFLFTLLLL